MARFVCVFVVILAAAAPCRADDAAADLPTKPFVKQLSDGSILSLESESWREKGQSLFVKAGTGNRTVELPGDVDYNHFRLVRTVSGQRSIVWQKVIQHRVSVIEIAVPKFKFWDADFRHGHAYILYSEHHYAQVEIRRSDPDKTWTQVSSFTLADEMRFNGTAALRIIGGQPAVEYHAAGFCDTLEIRDGVFKITGTSRDHDGKKFHSTIKEKE